MAKQTKRITKSKNPRPPKPASSGVTCGACIHSREVINDTRAYCALRKIYQAPDVAHECSAFVPK